MRFERTRVPGGFILAEAGAAPVADWFAPEYWGARGAGRPLGRGRGVALSAGAGGRWVLRHYRRGGVPGRWIVDRYLWTGASRARPVRELLLLADLEAAGAPVPHPVAAMVRRRGLRYRGDILIERVPDASTLAERAADLPEAAWSDVGRAIRRFHDAGGWHADLNAHNVLLAPSGVFVVDLDRGRRVDAGARAQRRNLDRLARSLRKLGHLPARADGWRALLAAYAGDRGR